MSASGNPRITGNTARQGGGVQVYAGGQERESYFYMEGGEISGNRVTADYTSYITPRYGEGGGVLLNTAATMIMSGAARIAGNTAERLGGGVYLPDGTEDPVYAGQPVFKIEGAAARITGNEAGDSGGGVYAFATYASNLSNWTPVVIEFNGGADKDLNITGNTPDDHNL
jgi:hypothetical protein